MCVCVCASCYNEQVPTRSAALSHTECRIHLRRADSRTLMVICVAVTRSTSLVILDYSQIILNVVCFADVRSYLLVVLSLKQRPGQVLLRRKQLHALSYSLNILDGFTLGQRPKVKEQSTAKHEPSFGCKQPSTTFPSYP